jgi:hypothetical protein
VDVFQVEVKVDHEWRHLSAHRATFMYNELTVLAHGREALALTKMAMRCAGRLMQIALGLSKRR